MCLHGKTSIRIYAAYSTKVNPVFMDNSFVYKQEQVFINNRPHNMVFPIRTVNTSDFIVFSIKQCLGLSHTNRYVEKVQLTYQCVSVQDLQQGEVCELLGWSQWHGAGAAGVRGGRGGGGGGWGGFWNIKPRLLPHPPPPAPSPPPPASTASPRHDNRKNERIRTNTQPAARIRQEDRS